MLWKCLNFVSFQHFPFSCLYLLENYAVNDDDDDEIYTISFSKRRYFTHQFSRQMHTKHNTTQHHIISSLINELFKVKLIRLSASSNLMLKIFYFLFQLFSPSSNQLAKYFINVQNKTKSYHFQQHNYLNESVKISYGLGIFHFCIIICD